MISFFSCNSFFKLSYSARACCEISSKFLFSSKKFIHSLYSSSVSVCNIHVFLPSFIAKPHGTFGSSMIMIYHLILGCIIFTYDSRGGNIAIMPLRIALFAQLRFRIGQVRLPINEIFLFPVLSLSHFLYPSFHYYIQ